MSISNLWYKLWSAWDWAKVGWNDADFDHSFLVTIMVHKFGRMQQHHEREQVVVGWHRYARQLKTCKILCQRMNAEDYDLNNTKSMEHEDYMYAQDLAFLSRLMRKYLRHWWD